jgi:hypothetical protein
METILWHQFPRTERCVKDDGGALYDPMTRVTAAEEEAAFFKNAVVVERGLAWWRKAEQARVSNMMATRSVVVGIRNTVVVFL